MPREQRGTSARGGRRAKNLPEPSSISMAASLSKFYLAWQASRSQILFVTPVSFAARLPFPSYPGCRGDWWPRRRRGRGEPRVSWTARGAGCLREREGGKASRSVVLRCAAACGSDCMREPCLGQRQRRGNSSVLFVVFQMRNCENLRVC